MMKLGLNEVKEIYWEEVELNSEHGQSMKNTGILGLQNLRFHSG